jgi:hypothetical protein
MSTTGFSKPEILCLVGSAPRRNNDRSMGLYRRLFKGASSRTQDAPRSPEDARAVSDLSEELRALKTEITKLREALDTDSDPQERGRSRRGGRNRSTRDSREDERSKGGSFSQRGRREGHPKTPPEDAPTGLLVDYLKQHKVLVFEGQDDLGQNEAFEHLARHMGQHFDVLAPFYEKMKRAVATGKTSRIDIDNYSEPERSAAVQLGTLLYRHGMLKDFYYHRSPKKQLRVIPNKDGEIQQFLTGGWLEIYVVWLLTRRLRARMNTAKYQVMFNVKGTLPDEREFESDLMACIDGRLLWLECKTGQWQDYSARFRGLVKTFGTDREGAGLVLIKPPDGSTRARATDMLDMTLLSLAQVGEFMDDFLGVPLDERVDDDERPVRQTRGGRSRGSDRGSEDEAQSSGGRKESQPSGGRSEARSSGARTESPAGGGRSEGSGRRDRDRDERTVQVPAGMIAKRSEPEIPLENPEPAKKLGKVHLDSDGAAAVEGELPRRRRRRRGGRGRGRGGDGGNGGNGGVSSEGRRSGLRDPLPVEPFTDEHEAAHAAQTELGDESSERANEASVEGEDRPRRRRGSRGGRGRKRRPEDEAGDEQADEVSESDQDVEVVKRAESRDESDPRGEAASEEREPRTRKRSAKPRSRREASSSDSVASESDASVEEASEPKPVRKRATRPAEKPAAEARPRRQAASTPEPKVVEEEPVATSTKSLSIPAGMVAKRPDGGAETSAAKPPVRRKAALPQVERVQREERTSSVIAPDLSAMMAGGAKKKAEPAQDADEAN